MYVVNSPDKVFPIAAVTNITKYISKVRVLENVNLEINNNEILVILGENGAGKSTLMKILTGLLKQDIGTINLDRDWFMGNTTPGRLALLTQTQINNPRDAVKIGIGMVHQDFQLVENMTVVENIILGQEFTYGNTPILDMKLAVTEVRELGRRFKLPIDPNNLVENLSVQMKQRVEILKQMYRKAQLIIMDEPTAILTPTEAQNLFKTIRQLKQSGKSIIFITQKLQEAIEIADRIVVFRQGQIVGEAKPGEISESQLTEMIVGQRAVDDIVRLPPTQFSGNVLKINNLVINDRFDKNIVNVEEFLVRTGEIIGVVGIEGNGQVEFIEAILGQQNISQGTILYYPHDESQPIDFVGMSILDILKQRVAYIPADRSKESLILDFQVDENLWLGYYHSKNYAEEYAGQKSGILRKLFLPKKLISSLAGKIIKDFSIETSSSGTTAKQLSSGNQQKLVVGRELAKNPRLIIAREPTRGIDIKVQDQIYQELLLIRNKGSGIILVSSDLDEILKLSDYIVVFYEGKLAGHGPVNEFNTLKLSQYMTTGQVFESPAKI